MNQGGTTVNQRRVTHIFLKDPEIVRRLEEQAAKEQRTKTAVVIRALERYFVAADEERTEDAA